MKTTLRYLHLNAQDTWHGRVMKHLENLHRGMAITAAYVVLEHRNGATPAFSVAIQLEVPGSGPHETGSRKSREKALLLRGPLVRGEGRDSTLEAALLKATQAVEHQVQTQKLRRRSRGKSQLQLSSISGRWNHVQPGRRT